MTVFACAGCGAVLTAPLSRVALPVHAHHHYGHDLLGALMEPGTYAVDPEPSGPPWRLWAEVDPAEAEARGVYAPGYALSYGPRGAVVIAPGDVRGTVPITERFNGLCCGTDGRDGPNLACAQCGQAVATLIDDCGHWQETWLHPPSVNLLHQGPAPRAAGWGELREQWPGTPPVEQLGTWSPLWETAIGAVLAHVLAASDGLPVTVPDGPVADVLRRPLEILIPAKAPARNLVLAGPGLPGTSADIALVPRHPQTGETWQAPEAAAVVPVAAEVWTYLAFHRDHRPVSRVPGGVRRDDPQPLLPWAPFRPHPRAFVGTLARLPEVRRPWLRAIHNHVSEHPFAPPF